MNPFCYPVVSDYLLVLEEHARFILNPCYSHNLCSTDAKPGMYFGAFRGTLEMMFWKTFIVHAACHMNHVILEC